MSEKAFATATKLYEDWHDADMSFFPLQSPKHCCAARLVEYARENGIPLETLAQNERNPGFYVAVIQAHARAYWLTQRAHSRTEV